MRNNHPSNDNGFNKGASINPIGHTIGHSEKQRCDCH